MKITLDFPPSANRYWRVGNGHIHRSAEAAAYKQYVGLICASAGLEPMDGDVSLTMHFYRPAKRGDLDNRVKILADSLQGWAFHDDSQIAEIHATRHEDKQCPRVELEINQI